MTTDPTPLTDDEWRAFQAIPDQGYSHRGWVDRKIAQRVRKAQANALRQAARDLSWFGAQGNTLDHLSAWDVVQTCMKAIESTADRIEKED